MKVKWSQWSPAGMIGHGEKELSDLMKDLRALGKSTAESLKNQEIPHAIYGMKMYRDGKLKEIRFYCDVYATDDDLKQIDKIIAPNILYVVHKF